MMITNQSCRCRPQQPCLVVLISFLLAAAAFAQAPPAPGPPPPPGPPIYHIYFDIRTQTFDELRIQIIAVLLQFSSTVSYNPPQVQGRFVLGPRRADFYDEPPAWIYIHVTVGEEPQDNITLAMAIDDLYIIGFSNGNGVWYKFSGEPTKSFKGLPGAIVLPIQYNYGALIDDGHEMLWKVPLGKESARLATKMLATYNHEFSPKAQLKDGLVRFVVMMGEGLRLREIRETFSGENWEKETFITQDQANSVVDWGTLSKLVIRFDLTGKWGGGRFKEVARKLLRKGHSKVIGPTEGVNKLDLLLRPVETLLKLTS